MAKDFRASQIRTNKLIASGSGLTSSLLIYPNVISTDTEGGFPTSLTSSVGTDVFLFVSGGIGTKNGSTKNISLFGGDVHVSGNLTIDGSSAGTLVQVVSSSTPDNDVIVLENHPVIFRDSDDTTATTPFSVRSTETENKIGTLAVFEVSSSWKTGILLLTNEVEKIRTEKPKDFCIADGQTPFSPFDPDGRELFINLLHAPGTFSPGGPEAPYTALGMIDDAGLFPDFRIIGGRHVGWRPFGENTPGINISIHAGLASTTGTGSGGNINLYAAAPGNGAGTPGNIGIFAANCTSNVLNSKPGGKVEIYAGNGAFGESGFFGATDPSPGGPVVIRAGTGGNSEDAVPPHRGGDVSILGGDAGNSGDYSVSANGGNVFVLGGERQYLGRQGAPYIAGEFVSIGTNIANFGITASYGTDVNFVVTGSINSRGSSVRGTSLFLGDVHVSGNFTIDGSGGPVVPSTINTRLHLGAMVAVTQSTPQATGGGFVVADEHLTGDARLKVVISSGNASNLAHVRLFNITDGMYVAVGSGSIFELNTSSTTPTVLTSYNLFGVIGFATTGSVIYEVHVSSSGGDTPLVAIQNSAELVFYA